MNTETGPLDEAESVMRKAADQLENLCRQMGVVEKHTRGLLQIVDQVLDYADKLELERNAWRFKAEELEKELRAARRDKAELAFRTGEARCPECGGAGIALVGDEDQVWLDCQECGHKEEMP